jgi:hypothetical protein
MKETIAISVSTLHLLERLVKIIDIKLFIMPTDSKQSEGFRTYGTIFENKGCCRTRSKAKPRSRDTQKQEQNRQTRNYQPPP